MAQYQLAVYEVTIVVKRPLDGSPPSEWDWPGLIDEDSDNVEFISEKYLGETTFTEVE